MQPRPEGVTWKTSLRSMTSPIRDCVEIGTPTTGSERYLGDSKTPEAGAIRLTGHEMMAFLRDSTRLFEALEYPPGE